jgi:glycerol-3-phosphate acyltransferase PlsY
LKLVIVALIAYIIGSFSSSYVLGKVLKKTDIRAYGSGNAGATNAVRVFGKKIGALAFILDVLKGVLAVYIGNRLLGYDGKLIAGFFVVVGHNWPIFLKFKGGKGIATSFGILLSIHWSTAISILLVFIIVVIISRYVSLASISAAIVAPVAVLIVKRPFDIKFFVMTSLLAILAIYRHRENIKRLLEGKEYRIGEKVKRG